jgi:hypothetical protein
MTSPHDDDDDDAEYVEQNHNASSDDDNDDADDNDDDDVNHRSDQDLDLDRPPQEEKAQDQGQGKGKRGQGQGKDGGDDLLKQDSNEGGPQDKAAQRDNDYEDHDDDDEQDDVQAAVATVLASRNKGSQSKRRSSSCQNKKSTAKGKNDSNGPAIGTATARAVVASIHTAVEAFVLPLCRDEIGEGGEEMVISLKRNGNGVFLGSSMTHRPLFGGPPAGWAQPQSQQSPYQNQPQQQQQYAQSPYAQHHQQAEAASAAKTKKRSRSRKSEGGRPKASVSSSANKATATPRKRRKSSRANANAGDDASLPKLARREATWERNFSDLLAWFALYKSWVVKESFDKSLNKWVREQRYTYRNSFRPDPPPIGEQRRPVIKQDHYERLYRVGFPFPDIEDVVWDLGGGGGGDGEGEDDDNFQTSLELHPPMDGMPIETQNGDDEDEEAALEWEQQLAKWVAHKAQTHTWKVDPKKDNSLSHWVTTQRFSFLTKYRNYFNNDDDDDDDDGMNSSESLGLPQDKYERLLAMGFDFPDISTTLEL